MKKPTYLFLFLFSFYSIFSLAQTHLITEQELDKQYEKITNHNSDENLKKLEELIVLSEKINYKKGIVIGKIKMLYVFYYRSDYRKLSELIEEIEDLKISDREQLAALYTYKSHLNKELGIEKEELQNIKDALKYAQQIKNPDKRHYTISTVYNRLAIYYDYKKADSLIYYLKKEIEELEQIQDDNKNLKAEKYSTIALNYVNIGNYYLGVHQPQRLDLAEPYYLKAYEYAMTKPDITKMHSMAILCGVGRFYMEKGEYEKSIELANEVLKQEKDKKNPAYRLYAYMLLDDSYAGLKKPEEQVKYTKLHATLNDSLNKVAKKEASQQFDKLVTNVEKKKDEAYGSLFLFLGGIILAIFLYVWIYWKRKNRDMHKKTEMLIARINTERVHKKEQQNPLQETISNNGTSSINITEETIKTLLLKLEKFETSDKYLKKNINQTWLANNLNTNTKYLSEIIKTHRNKTFTDYINGLRINYIIHKLVEDPLYREYKINYLAEECGYASSQVFVIAFKKETGLTPSFFIEKLKEGNSVA